MKPYCLSFFTLAIILIAFNLTHAQNVGIGTPTPNAKLHVNGTFKVTDGSQGAGKILTSDAAGLASWQTPPTPPAPTYYPSASICCQTWMTKNLDVATYRNGDPIPKVTDASTWGALTTGAYCYFNNDSATYAATYGKLYNWYAVVDPRGLAPEGWHIPSEYEWATLGTCLGGNGVAGGPLKSEGLTYWSSPNAGANNYCNFTALPGGKRIDEGIFYSLGLEGYWWSSVANGTTNAWMRSLDYAIDDLVRSDIDKGEGLSIRCIRD
jgi:uncharacterized protein (TIGR02145 family)